MQINQKRTKSISIERKAGVSAVSAEYVIFKGHSLNIFENTFDLIPSALSMASNGALASNGFQGIVGNPVLKRYNAIFDYQNKKM